MQEEIARIENWSSGDFDCLKCGKTLHLWFNGGELDSKECCGIVYETKHRQIDLVITTENNIEIIDQRLNLMKK